MPVAAGVTRSASLFWRILAGVEAGVIAGGVMLLYLMLDAAVSGSGIWSVFNLFSSNFYGSSALGGAFRKTTVAGLAWHVGLSGVLGVATSLALGPFLGRPMRCALIGALIAAGWYYAVVRFLWPQWNPLAFRQPFPGLLFGHLIFGIAMGAYPKLLAGLREDPPA